MSPRLQAVLLVFVVVCSAFAFFGGLAHMLFF